MSINFVSKKNQALTRARSLSGEKGIINLGAGCSRMGFSESTCNLPEVVVNVDLTTWGPKAEIHNLQERLPFADGEFDVAFASHVLEHLDHWQEALNDWTRIADHAIIVLPNPLSIGGWIHSEHKQHFSFGDINFIRQNWAVEVYC
ncbi:class I SAM-dependent methyltransferase [Patescibacteria group bacterium]|nr:class I SAM-dependent methyltransferase [Patescibacteria group bacterium]